MENDSPLPNTSLKRSLAVIKGELRGRAGNDFPTLALWLKLRAERIDSENSETAGMASFAAWVLINSIDAAIKEARRFPDKLGETQSFLSDLATYPADYVERPVLTDADELAIYQDVCGPNFNIEPYINQVHVAAGADHDQVMLAAWQRAYNAKAPRHTEIDNGSCFDLWCQCLDIENPESFSDVIMAIVDAHADEARRNPNPANDNDSLANPAVIELDQVEQLFDHLPCVERIRTIERIRHRASNNNNLKQFDLFMTA